MNLEKPLKGGNSLVIEKKKTLKIDFLQKMFYQATTWFQSDSCDSVIFYNIEQGVISFKKIVVWPLT